jgi:hypothetical protein
MSEKEPEEIFVLEEPIILNLKVKTKEGHIQFHFKCMECRLEFTIYSQYFDCILRRNMPVVLSAKHITQFF